MAARMAFIHMVAVLCMFFTVTQADDQEVFEKLLKRIDTLELQGRLQQRRIDEQDTLLERYEVRMNQYADTLQEYSNRIEQLENQLTTTEQDRDGDTDPVTLHTKEYRNDTNETVSKTTSENNISTRNSFGKVNINEIQKLPRFVLANGDGPIAFHATHDIHGLTYNIGTNQHILFEDVHLNTGNGFHAQHGLFIAPRSGIYIFSFSIMAANDGTDIIAAILKDGTTLAKAYAGGASSKYDQGSVSIVTHLSIGGEVWISSIERASVKEYGGMFVSFMGCLLSDD